MCVHHSISYLDQLLLRLFMKFANPIYLITRRVAVFAQSSPTYYISVIGSRSHTLNIVLYLLVIPCLRDLPLVVLSRGKSWLAKNSRCVNFGTHTMLPSYHSEAFNHPAKDSQSSPIYRSFFIKAIKKPKPL